MAIVRLPRRWLAFCAGRGSGKGVAAMASARWGGARFVECGAMADTGRACRYEPVAYEARYPHSALVGSARSLTPLPPVISIWVIACRLVFHVVGMVETFSYRLLW